MNPTCFSQLLGHESIKRQLRKMISGDKIGHALLFAGPDGVGKSLFARELAVEILSAGDKASLNHAKKVQAGNHPDLHLYHPEGKLGMHSIQALRELCEEVYLPPFESSWKVMIIHEADRMLSFSANALLKTFEEPPPFTVIILLCRSRASLLPTILSRCRTFQFLPLPASLIQSYLRQHCSLEDSAAEKIAFRAKGSLGKALRLVEQGGAMQENLLSIFANGYFPFYRTLQEAVDLAGKQVEERKKSIEESAKEQFQQIYMDQATPHQQHAIEKEIEGIAALTISQETDQIFEWILSWYRDIHLLLAGGCSSFLMNPELSSEIMQAIQRGEIQPLDKVYQAIEEARSSLQHSMPISLCLENLFLKLDRI